MSHAWFMFVLGTVWGASMTGLILWHWLIKPMGLLLGFEDDEASA